MRLIVLLLLLWCFSHQRSLIVVHLRLCDSKSPQVSRTLLHILAHLNNAVVWMVSTRPLISRSSSPFTNPLVIVIIIITILILMSRVFDNGPGVRGSIPGRVISKTQKMVLDAALLNTQFYKVRIKGKVEQFKERSIPSPYTSV